MEEQQLNLVFDTVMRLSAILQRFLVDHREAEVGQISANNNSVEALSTEENVMNAQLNKLDQQAPEKEFLLYALQSSVTSQDVPGFQSTSGRPIGVKLKLDDFRELSVAHSTFGRLIDVSLKPDVFRKLPRSLKDNNRRNGTTVGYPTTTTRELGTSTLRGNLVTTRNGLTPTYCHILSEAHRLKA